MLKLTLFLTVVLALGVLTACDIPPPTDKDIITAVDRCRVVVKGADEVQKALILGGKASCIEAVGKI